MSLAHNPHIITDSLVLYLDAANAKSYRETSGTNLVVNGTFDTDTIWLKNVDWTIGGGVATCDGVGTGKRLYQINILESNKRYRYSFDYNRSSGTSISFDYHTGADYINIDTFSNASGTATGEFTTGISNGSIYFGENGNWAGTVDNVSVELLSDSWHDLSGNRNTGTLISGSSYNTGSGGSIQFDGTDDYVDCGDVNHGSAFTIAAWINATVISGDSRVILCKNTENDMWPCIRLIITTNGTLYGSYSTPVYGQCLEGAYSSAGAVTTGLWYYVAFSKDIGDYTTMKLYINGESISYSNYLYGDHVYSADVADSTKSVLIGRRFDTPNWIDPFYGRMSNIRIYNRALSQSEITQNYNAHKSRFNL